MRSKRAKLSIGGVVLSSHIGEGWPPRLQSSGVLALRCRYLSHPRERSESIGYPFPGGMQSPPLPTLNRWQPGVASQSTQPCTCICRAATLRRCSATWTCETRVCTPLQPTRRAPLADCYDGKVEVGGHTERGLHLRHVIVWPAQSGRELCDCRGEQRVPVAVGRILREHYVDHLKRRAGPGHRLVEVLDVAARLVEHTGRVVVGASGSLCPVIIVDGLRAATASRDASHASRDS